MRKPTFLWHHSFMKDPSDAARRFFEGLMGAPLEPFDGPEQVWDYMPRLLEFAQEKRPLPPLCLTLLGELSLAVGLRAGAPPQDVAGAIERTFGYCPMEREELQLIARYVWEQRNGSFTPHGKKKGPSLGGEF